MKRLDLMFLLVMSLVMMSSLRALAQDVRCVDKADAFLKSINFGNFRNSTPNANKQCQDVAEKLEKLNDLNNRRQNIPTHTYSYTHQPMQGGPEIAAQNKKLQEKLRQEMLKELRLFWDMGFGEKDTLNITWATPLIDAKISKICQFKKTKAFLNGPTDLSERARVAYQESLFGDVDVYIGEGRIKEIRTQDPTIEMRRILVNQDCNLSLINKNGVVATAETCDLVPFRNSVPGLLPKTRAGDKNFVNNEGGLKIHKELCEEHFKWLDSVPAPKMRVEPEGGVGVDIGADGD